jgi:hypothetical protein
MPALLTSSSSWPKAFRLGKETLDLRLLGHGGLYRNGLSPSTGDVSDHLVSAFSAGA